MTDQQPLNDFQRLDNPGAGGAGGDDGDGSDELSTTELVFALVIGGAALVMLGCYWMFGEKSSDQVVEERERAPVQEQSRVERHERQMEEYRAQDREREFQESGGQAEEPAIPEPRYRSNSDLDEMSDEELRRGTEREIIRSAPADQRAAVEEAIDSDGLGSPTGGASQNPSGIADQLPPNAREEYERQVESNIERGTVPESMR